MAKMLLTKQHEMSKLKVHPMKKSICFHVIRKRRKPWLEVFADKERNGHFGGADRKWSAVKLALKSECIPLE